MKVLVTGVAGFMGSHLAERFLSEGHEVVGIDNLVGGYLENIPSGVKFHNVDLGDLDLIDPIFQDVDLCVHTACTAYEGLSVFSPALITRNTFHITATVLSACVRNRVKKIVHMSSMARYGTQDSVPFTESMEPKPQDPYGIAKLAAEMLIKNISETHGLDYVILVPHNIIGPRQKYDDPFRNVASIMVNRALQNKPPIIYGDGEQKRCFSFINDVIDPLMVACFSSRANGQVINIGPDEEYVSINQLGRLIAEIMGREFSPIYFNSRPKEVRDANCSADLARELLGFKTSTSLREGLMKLVEWIETRGVREFNYHLPIEINNETTPETWKQKLI